MEGSAMNTATARSTDDDRNACAPAVSTLCCEIRNLIESAGNEIRELHFRDRPHPHQCGANGRSHNSRFRNRRIDDAPLAKSLEHACSDFERAAVNADIFAEDEDTIVLFHFLPNALTNRFDVSCKAHCSVASKYTSFRQSSGSGKGSFSAT